ncbi:winged helix-turn-helix domain-containing protein [Marinibactrum halimedae]|uniref:DNA-binding response regulator n=1 Tax=Marinibactrum halimedae TaxID=1444977 RepID=A0AA37T6Z7_9GAMM|nr:winged helix-turn-helix domain-containing protein [Marinibactrum halimedae]MCD9458945.1 winged helix-turn-helix domain-containing protein [Marinibactrum halimedae]GLS26926.1 DNA-binding response regulator [Marinibactrum halimedae]
MSHIAPKILIIDDDSSFATTLKSQLHGSGWDSQWIQYEDDALSQLKSIDADLVIIGTHQSQRGNAEICRSIRKVSSVGIIMITRVTEEIDWLLSLEIGANDFLCAPYTQSDLNDRMQRVLKEIYTPRAAKSEPYTIDEKSGTITLFRKTIPTTWSEFLVLATLLKSPGHIFSKSQLARQLSKDTSTKSAESTIDKHIDNLQKLIKSLFNGQDIIQSIYGVGYKVVV